ncbi:hypothetical protein Pelo_18053 [Pelomyxa schiedti]|nr:hypothetical protein Pelo_18053 [Pelomyxa schiedti]
MNWSSSKKRFPPTLDTLWRTAQEFSLRTTVPIDLIGGGVGVSQGQLCGTVLTTVLLLNSFSLQCKEKPDWNSQSAYRTPVEYTVTHNISAQVILELFPEYTYLVKTVFERRALIKHPSIDFPLRNTGDESEFCSVFPDIHLWHNNAPLLPFRSAVICDQH